MKAGERCEALVEIEANGLVYTTKPNARANDFRESAAAVKGDVGYLFLGDVAKCGKLRTRGDQWCSRCNDLNTDESGNRSMASM